MRPVLTIAALAAVAAAGAGCGGKVVSLLPPQPTADANFNAAWDAAVQTLREYRFSIDRADRRAGVITTFPLTGRHWFEFWRDDAATRRDVLEGTLQTVYRRAVVRIRRKSPAATTATAPAAEYVAEVVVRTSRSDRPAARITSASEAFEMFLDPYGIAREVDTRAPAKPVTVDLGEDKALAEEIQTRINSLTAKRLSIYPR